MAYSLGTEFVAESTMDLLPEAIPIAITGPEGDSATGSSAETPLTNMQPENAPNTDKEDLCPEAKQNAIPSESEPEGNVATGSSAEPPLINKQPENASNTGPENASNTDKEDLCPEAKQNAIPSESEPEGNVATGSSAEPPLINKQPENASNTDKEDLCPEAKQNAIPSESEPEGNVASGSSAEPPLINKQPENASNTGPKKASNTGPKHASNAKHVPNRSPWCVCVRSTERPKPVNPNASGSSHSGEPQGNASALPSDDVKEMDVGLFYMRRFEIPNLHAEYGSAKIEVFIIATKVAVDYDGTYTLKYAHDIVLAVCPYETIRRVKAKFTEIFKVLYEDMAVVFNGKFLSDARSLEYYYIKKHQYVHLLLEKPHKRFKQVFECFKRLGMDEETAWFSTRNYIVIESYKNKEMSNNEMMKGLEDVFVLESDVDSNESLPPHNEPDECHTDSDGDD